MRKFVVVLNYFLISGNLADLAVSFELVLENRSVSLDDNRFERRMAFL